MLVHASFSMEQAQMHSKPSWRKSCRHRLCPCSERHRRTMLQPIAPRRASLEEGQITGKQGMAMSPRP